MLDPTTIPAAARLYLRPEQFVESPVDRDGEVARLAGGLNWFAAYELIAVGDAATQRASVPVSALPGLLANLPEPQAARVRTLAERISAPRPALQLGERVLRFDQPAVMGILDCSDDDDPAAAAQSGFDLTAAGAALVDVSGESARPGAAAVWEGDEIARVVPVIEGLAASGAAIAVSTRKAAVMRAALTAGAHLVNDVSALAWDGEAAGVVAAAGCSVVLMSSPEAVSGGDAALAAFDWLEARIAAVAAAGVDRARILLDPGIGFGKSLADSLALLNGLALFHGLGCALMLGSSRKRIVGALSHEAPVGERLGGSLALALHGANHGVQLLRVHDVAETVQALRVWRGLKDAALSAIR